MVTDQREELLRLLRAAALVGRDIQSLLELLARRCIHSIDLAVELDEALDASCRHQVLLAQCIRRIEGEAAAQPCSRRVCATFAHPTLAEPAAGTQHDVGDLRMQVLSEIAIFEAAIVAAESSGLFETRLACETILAQTLSMSRRLSTYAAGGDVAGQAVTQGAMGEAAAGDH